MKTIMDYKERMLTDSEPVKPEHNPGFGDLVLVSDDGIYWSVMRFNAIVTRLKPGEDPDVRFEVMALDDSYVLTYRLCHHIGFCSLPEVLVKKPCGVVVSRIVGIKDVGSYSTTYGEVPADKVIFTDDLKFGGDNG